MGKGKIVGKNKIFRGKGSQEFPVEYLGFGVWEKPQQIKNVVIKSLEDELEEKSDEDQSDKSEDESEDDYEEAYY